MSEFASFKNDKSKDDIYLRDYINNLYNNRILIIPYILLSKYISEQYEKHNIDLNNDNILSENQNFITILSSGQITFGELYNYLYDNKIFSIQQIEQFKSFWFENEAFNYINRSWENLQNNITLIFNISDKNNKKCYEEIFPKLNIKFESTSYTYLFKTNKHILQYIPSEKGDYVSFSLKDSPEFSDTITNSNQAYNIFKELIFDPFCKTLGKEFVNF